MNLIDGRTLANRIKDDVAKEVFGLCIQANTRRPSLAIVLVGERPDSQLYVNLKDKAAKGVGIDTNLYKFDDSVAEAKILDTINFLNADDTVDGILVQLPLPENLDTDKIVNTIAANKDVDGFAAASVAKLTKGEVISPVFQSVLACLEEAKFDLRNKSVAIVAKPGIFIDSLDKLLEYLGAQVTSVGPNEIGTKTATADLLISAVGSPHLIKAEHIKADAILIDIGISQNEAGKTCGDVDAESVKDKATWLTPVPGGIGPLTIAFALKNTLAFYKARNHKSQIPNLK
jgi:methylenetetrahydrofolate dehydrogenase (NADP+)/methenyltetrahydrofolate cyclohydrolase